ncbi:T9SS type A sorting domain-containing protein [Chitinophaga sp. XS-30]|uniref:T9SS type A sorting domain-containing protein n=1 Tax=Chitinophaga sp. XS-30 TaxID=2604421 RepID=UPI00143D15B0|nr:T9SS type A sorting domain-containing protein [Chitinophaga sp. XS-30]
MRSFIPVFLLLLCCASDSFAQQGIYIPAEGKVCATGALPVTFYLNTRNDGSFGSKPGATIYFLGQQWTNGNGASLSDEGGTGGIFRFSGNNPLYGSAGRQLLFGGYNAASGSGSSFPSLTVDNPDGIELGDLNDLKVRNTLHFQNGHIFLNGWNLVVGDHAPGQITGYSDRRFVVTGGGIAGGFLYREQLGSPSGNVVFPVGTAPGSYSPVAIHNSGAADVFRARVFDNVYNHAITGAAMQDTFIHKTWNIGRNHVGNGHTRISFQHTDAEEMPSYRDNRQSSFLNRYDDPYWVAQSGTVAAEGDLTTYPLQQPATMHTQQLEAGMRINEYFSKSTRIATPGPQIKWVRFDANRLSPSQVGLLWTTWYEVNNDRFEVERRLETENTFTTVGVVPTRAINGNSLRLLDYNTVDHNNFQGWSYYRIKAVLRNGNVEYSDIRPVPPMKQVEIFPNPNYGHFKVRISGVRTAMRMQITNAWGQILRQYDIDQEGDISVTGLPAATYFLVIMHKGTQVVMHTAKIVVLK